MKYQDDKTMMYYDDSLWGCDQKGPAMSDDCCAAKIKCKPTKECVKTYKCYYKLYKTTHYHLYKICPHCGQEFNYHYYQGICPYCC